MNDALMIGIVLTLVFGSIIFYLYNRLSMTEKKLGLFEGILTDLKVMMDSAPFTMAPPPHEYRDTREFEPSPEYLNAISGPLPLQKEDIEDVVPEEEYQQTLEQALNQAIVMESKEPPSGNYRTLQIDDSNGPPQPIQVTKLSPELDTMTVKDLQSFAKSKGISLSAGLKRSAIIEQIKKALSSQDSMDGPTPPSMGASLDEPLTTLGESL